MKRFIFFVVLLFTFSTANAENLSGYTLHKNSKGVMLYYKVDDYGVTFKVKNTRDDTVHVIINNVSANWTDGKRRTKDVVVSYANPGRIASGRFDYADNYSKMKRWSFDGWRWSTRYDDL